MLEKIVIIGGGTAGASAAFAARKTNRKAEITVLEEEPYSTYSRCGLPFVIKGIIPEFKNLIVFPESFYKQQRIVYRNNVLVTSIDTETKTVHFKTKTSPESINYNALVIVTGARPARPPIKGSDQPGVYLLRTIADGQAILNSSSQTRRAFIVGASFIGLEVAEALATKGIQVTVVETLRLLWRIVDKDIGDLIKQHLVKKGLDIKEQTTVQQINKQKDHLQITMSSSSGKTAPPNESLTDMVIIATGIKPEIRLAQTAGIHLGPTGGIKINQRAETNLKNIYAAGDCTEVTTSITGESIISGLGTTAARHGLVAGTNAAGGNEVLPKILNTSILKLWGMEVASTGVTEEHALNRQLANKSRPLSLLVKHKSLPHYYPGGVDVWVKLIALSGSGQLIGAQLVGATTLNGRINLLVLAIAKGLTINELAQSDFCYAPPCNDIWDPVVVAAKGLQQRILRNA